MKEVPRVLPKDEDPRLVNRNRRMLGRLLGTLEVWSIFNGLLFSLKCYQVKEVPRILNYE